MQCLLKSFAHSLLIFFLSVEFESYLHIPDVSFLSGMWFTKKYVLPIYYLIFNFHYSLLQNKSLNFDDSLSFFPFCGLCSWCHLGNLCLSLHLKDCLLCSNESDSRTKYPMCGLLGPAIDNYRVACDWQPTWGGNCCPRSSWHTASAL